MFEKETNQPTKDNDKNTNRIELSRYLLQRESLASGVQRYNETRWKVKGNSIHSRILFTSRFPIARTPSNELVLWFPENEKKNDKEKNPRRYGKQKKN